MKNFFIVMLALCFTSFTARSADETETKAKFDEVYKLISEHLADSDADTMNSAAVQGLLKQLSPHVQLNPGAAEPGEEISLIAKTNRFNREFGYIRISEVQTGLREEFMANIESMLSEGALSGLVIDLRFAGGNNYEAATEFAGLFASDVPAVITASRDKFEASSGDEAILIPLMVLANHETKGAAEATAAVLRDIKAGLIIGNETAGQATVFENFELSSGDTIRIATEPVRLRGGKGIPLNGVTPDIKVNVPSDEERVFLDDPYFADESTNGSSPNSVNRRITEADLVRQRRENISLERILSDRENNPTNRAKIVTDPSLARALDVLKALTVVENWK